MTWIDIEVDGGSSMPAYVATEAGDRKGAVIVIHEVFGVTAHIESVCDRLAHDGWLAVAPAIYHRVGSPVFAYSGDPGWEAAMDSLQRDHLDLDLRATAAYLSDRGISSAATATIGFCLGGYIAMFAATVVPVAAVVTFYGVAITEGRFGVHSMVEMAPTLRSPWLGLYGAEDNRAPEHELAALREALLVASVPTELIVYDGAGHAFHCDARPDRYREAAAHMAWESALGFLDTHVSSGGAAR